MVRLKMKSPPIEIDKGVETVEWRLPQSQVSGTHEVHTRNGLEFSVLEMNLAFERRHTYWITQVVFPTVLFFTISCVQFWVDPACAPARAALGVIAVLINVN